MADGKDGGPAFPIPNAEMAIAGQTVKETQGMTLRQWYAGLAMQGLLASESDPSPCNDQDNPEPEQKKYAESLAEAAFRLADAMLSASTENPR